MLLTIIDIRCAINNCRHHFDGFLYPNFKERRKYMRQNSVTAKNRPSPSNESDWIEAYKKVFSNASNEDNYDIAAVVTISGICGHALMHQSYNRAHDNQYHICFYFISDDELKYYL